MITVLRWIIGIISLVLATGATVSLVAFIALDIPSWLDRARWFRHGLYLALLFWFNVEVWGRVIWTIVTW